MLISLLPAFGALLTLVSALDLSKLKHAGNVVPGRYIVEFDTNADLQASISKRGETPHTFVYRQMEERGIVSSVFAEFDSDLFVGASITLDNQNDLGALAMLQGVINISPVHVATAPMTSTQHQQAVMAEWGVTGTINIPGPAPVTASISVSGNVSVSAYAAPSTTTTCTGRGKQKTCTTSTISSKPSSTSTSSAPSSSATFTGFGLLGDIGAAKIQAAGNTGKGIKVAIVDTGVDYTRTPLGGCFGPQCKVIGGYDYVGDGYAPGVAPAPGPDPIDQCNGHGTFIAGIVGANPGPSNIYKTVGVAPDASLLAYRVFGCGGYSTYDIIMQAMMQAYKDGADIINLSLGDPSGWTEDPTAVLASRLTAKGVVVSISTGNDGETGAFFAGKPGNSIGPITAASVNSSIYPAQNITYPGYGPISYFSFQPFPLGTYPIVSLTNNVNSDPNAAADGCGTLPAGTDYTGKIVILRPGGCPLGTKGRNVFESGARLIWFVTSPGGIPQYLNFPVPTAFLPTDQGNFLIEQTIKGNASVTITFNPYAYPNLWTTNQLSYFSSIGPTFNLYPSVQLATVGTNVVGLAPTALGNFTLGTGTSASAGFISGAAALYLAAQGNSNATPQQIREAFQANAIPVTNPDNSIHTIAGQGSGRFRLDNVLNSGIAISPTELLLNDTAYSQYSQQFTVTNTGSKFATFKVQHVPANTVFTYPSGSNQANQQTFNTYIPTSNNGANVWISTPYLALVPGQSQDVFVTFTPPSGLNAAQFPIYSGYIQVTSGQATANTFYLGVAAAMYDMPVLDPTSAYTGINTPVILDASGNVQAGSEAYNFSNGDYPTVLYRQAGGSPRVLIDLVAVNASLGFTPNYTTRAFEGEMGELKREVREYAMAKRQWLPWWGTNGGNGGDNGNGNNGGGDNGIPWLGGINNFICQLTNNQAPGCQQSSSPSTFGAVPILGNLFEADYAYRNAGNDDDVDFMRFDINTFDFSAAQFSNGTTVPNGTYRFLLRALHITGNPTSEADYDSWLSMPFVVAQ